MWWMIGLACARPPQITAPEVSVADPTAVAGVTHPALRSLLAAHWEDAMARDPVGATAVGDHRYDDRLGDGSAAGVAAREAAQRGFLDQARRIDPADLSGRDQETLAVFVWDRQTSLDLSVCQGWTYGVSPRDNPLAWWGDLPETHRVETPRDGATLVARYRAMGQATDDAIANLRAGLAAGRVENATSVKLTIEQLETQLAQPPVTWGMRAPAGVDRPGWPEGAQARFAADLDSALVGVVAPAFSRFHALLRDEILPVARPDDRLGVKFLPDGDRCYRAAIARHATRPLAPDAVHQTGLAELARIHGEMKDLGQRLFGTRDLPAIFARLRTDKALYFADADAIEAKATATLRRAEAALPLALGRLPKTPCQVRRVPDHIAPYSYVAWYSQPNPDGSKPGEYFVNTSAPTTRPIYEAEALAFHESVPGHHTQIALSQEDGEVPAFRRHLYVTAYAEGWALYAEGLADELGLYSGDLDRLGRLSFDSWRAARLVVDTGIHAQGWSREQAVRFFLENTPLAENNVRNEVDRYVTWPGQALGYKLGELELRRLRAESEAKLGAGFDRRAFHDAVLRGGDVPLPLLEARVRRWSDDATK